MEINKIKNNIKLLYRMPEQPITPFIKGIPGVGKSAIFGQIKKELGMDSIIDLRMAYHDSTDIKGIPNVQNDILRWVSPEFLPLEGNKKYEGTRGILVFDEINRANSETIQSVFEVILDRRVAGKKILPNWYIGCAGNMGYEDNCNVTELDSAFMNRVALYVITQEDVTMKSWSKWEGFKNINPRIIEFLKINPRFLYNNTVPDQLITPRSWEAFSKILNNCSEDDYPNIINDNGPGIIYHATNQFHQSFVQYLENRKLMSPEKLLNGDIENAKKYLANIERAELYRLCIELAESVKQIKKATKKKLDNFNVVFQHIDDDHKIAFLKNAQNNKNEPCEFVVKFLKNSEFNDENSELHSLLAKAL